MVRIEVDDVQILSGSIGFSSDMLCEQCLYLVAFEFVMAVLFIKHVSDGSMLCIDMRCLMHRHHRPRLRIAILRIDLRFVFAAF